MNRCGRWSKLEIVAAFLVRVVVAHAPSCAAALGLVPGKVRGGSRGLQG